MIISYDKSISEVAIYNLMGQEVQFQTSATTISEVDMSQLPSGIYMVRFTSESQVKTIKVVKE